MKKNLKNSVLTIIAMIAVTLSVSGQNYNFYDTSFYSPILDETKSMRIYLPPGYYDDTTSYPVVYYLHGATESYEILIQFMPQLQSMMDNGYIHPMVIVGLDGQCEPFYGSMYTNSILYGNYEDYIIQEAIPFAESVLRTKNSPQYRCIMGFAMGGYGSMKLAIKHTDLFAGIASYNGILQFDTTLVMWQPEVISENPGPPYNYQFGAGFFTDLIFTGAGAFSPNLNILPYQVELVYDTFGALVDSVIEKWKEHDCSRLAKELDTISSNYPGIFFACGIYDFLYFHPTNLCFADTLDDLGIDYEFLTTDDGHILSEEILQAGMHFLDSVMYDSISVGDIEYFSGKPSTLSIYPNPSSNYITIETSAIPTRSQVTIMNMNGQVLIKHKISELKTLIDISKLHSGLYFCCVRSGDQVVVKKIIKQ